MSTLRATEMATYAVAVLLGLAVAADWPVALPLALGLVVLFVALIWQDMQQEPPSPPPPPPPPAPSPPPPPADAADPDVDAVLVLPTDNTGFPLLQLTLHNPTSQDRHVSGVADKTALGGLTLMFRGENAHVDNTFPRLAAVLEASVVPAGKKVTFSLRGDDLFRGVPLGTYQVTAVYDPASVATADSHWRPAPIDVGTFRIELRGAGPDDFDFLVEPLVWELESMILGTGQHSERMLFRFDANRKLTALEYGVEREDLPDEGSWLWFEDTYDFVYNELDLFELMVDHGYLDHESTWKAADFPTSYDTDP